MKRYIKADAWNIIEEGFDPHLNKISESIFSIGNGKMGQRANFEEKYTGESLQGSYVAGIYYPDKTRVGWWKNGYPEYFAKVLNAASWIGIDVRINGETLDLAQNKVVDFRRVLNMRDGLLERTFTVELKNGNLLKVRSIRFCSIADDEVGAIKYEIIPLSSDVEIEVLSYIDGDVKNQDSNYDEKFWDLVEQDFSNGVAVQTLRTKRTEFDVATGITTFVTNGDKEVNLEKEVSREKFIGQQFSTSVVQNTTLTIFKYAAIVNSENYQRSELSKVCGETVTRAAGSGFVELLKSHSQSWHSKWAESDIVITGDISAQQAIRFNIFQLNQTYTGKDSRLNIGPKGFTGEKYGGSTYWDTEAYCVPFYLATAPSEVSKNLLIYRYKHLPKAIENAEKLGFGNGAALYPMVTINGEECHNEWEITFEEIHRNGAIAYAIFNYIRYTGDTSYLNDYGLEVLVGIARFWKQRVNWSEERQKFVMLGVTGPNEYENNVNNNWYTNILAVWCLRYAQEAAKMVKESNPATYYELLNKLALDDEQEFADWNNITNNMYFPEDEQLGIFLQQDGFLDKEQVLVKDLPETDRPLNQKWSWDRILRSCFIKQADVLQGLYFFEDEYDQETLRRNFDFYEARTVHESSLSPCIHSILAARLNDEERAYEFYLRTARLDLDDYNNDTEDGLHITSMAGTWMSVVEGFAGMKVRNDQLMFNPFLPEKWSSFSFTIRFRDNILLLNVGHEGVTIQNKTGSEITVKVHEVDYQIGSGKAVTADYNLKV